MPYFIPSGIPVQNQVAGEPAALYVLHAFIAGSSTPTNIFSDNAGAGGATTKTTDSEGYIQTSTVRHPVWLDTGISYDLELREDDDTTVVWKFFNITADDGGIYAAQVNGVTALRGLTPGTATVYLNYHTTAGDKGYGFYRPVTGASPGTYVDNGGGIILPSGGDGSAAFLKMEPVSVRSYGAVGDGVADDTAALAACFAAEKNVYWPAGTYNTTTAIPLSSGLKIRGDGSLAEIAFSGVGYAMENPDKLSSAISKIDIDGFTIQSPNGFGLDLEGVFESTAIGPNIFIEGNTSAANAGTYGLHTGWSAGSSGQASYWIKAHFGRIRGFDEGWRADPNSNALDILVGRFRAPMISYDVNIAPPNGVNVSSGINFTLLDISNTGASVSVFCDARNVRGWMRHEASNTVGFQLGANHRAVDMTWSTTAANVTQVLDNKYVDGVIRRGRGGSATYEIYSGYDVKRTAVDAESESIGDNFMGSALSELWTETTAGGGTATLNHSTAGAGVVELDTSGSGTSDMEIAFGVAPVRSFAQNTGRFRARVRLEILTQCLVQFGFRRNTDAAPLDDTKSGVWFENDPTAAAVNWFGHQADGVTEETEDTGQLAAVETLTFVVDVDEDGRGKFYINGEEVADLTASGGNNTNRMVPFFFIDEKTASARTLTVESFNMSLDLASWT